jgi:hypothetical protein
MGIKAYHGSPHDFDRFDMSKIGTGEGAQAYGHGLYFAGNEGVAKGYRKALSRGIDDTGLVVRIDGRTVSDPTRDQLHAARFGIDSAEQTIRRQIDGARPKLATASTVDELGIGVSERELAQMGIDELTRRLDEVKRLSGRIEMAPAGRMYEVNLNTTPDRLLDWDAPLAQQPDIVRRLTKEAYHGDPSPRLTGKDVIDNVFTQVGPARRSEAMREAGLDGIKYLDAGSRAAGDGSRNYVMFDDKLVQILRKYGVATAAALPAAALAELGMSREEARRSF